MSHFLSRILKSVLVVLVPILLVAGSALLLATDTYLGFEYGKASFPPDSYGFTPQQRFDLASTNIHYVRAHLPDNALSSETLNGAPVYNEREVTHMADVQRVFQAVLSLWRGAAVLFLFLGWLFWQNKERMALSSAIRSGGLLSAGIILTIALMALFAWQTWFELFHRFFFVPGSWLFSYTDTLIRLFPIKFWFDATLAISLFSFTGGLLLVWLGWYGQKVMAERPRA